MTTIDRRRRDVLSAVAGHVAEAFDRGWTDAPTLEAAVAEARGRGFAEVDVVHGHEGEGWWTRYESVDVETDEEAAYVLAEARRVLDELRPWKRAIAALLAATGWTQQQAAEAIGCTQGAVNHWLTGRSEPIGLYAREARRVLAAHGVPQP